MKENKIRKGLPPKRDPTCYEISEDITVPKGTILRKKIGTPDTFVCQVGLIGEFSINIRPGDIHSHYRRVVTA